MKNCAIVPDMAGDEQVWTGDETGGLWPECLVFIPCRPCWLRRAAWDEEIIIQAIDSCQIEGYLKIFIRFQVAFCMLHYVGLSGCFPMPAVSRQSDRQCLPGRWRGG